MNNLVSVIIPVYNVKEYLNECVSSVISQTYNLLEIILVDDGSTDGSGCMCDELAVEDERIKVVHKQNGGLSSARNCGIMNSTGEYIYFLDSDDYIEKDAIEILVDLIEKNNLDFVAFNGKSFYEYNNVKREYDYKAYQKTRGKYHLSTGPHIYLELKKNKEFYPCVPMHFYRLEFLKKNNILFKEGILHEDELFSALAYYHAERVDCCYESLYGRRIRNNSIMTEKMGKKNVKSCVIIIDELIKELLDNKRNEAIEKEQMMKTALAHCLWLLFLRYSLLDIKEKQEVKDDYSRIKQFIKKNQYFNSSVIKKCFFKRFLLPFRKNNKIYFAYKKLFEKRNKQEKA